MNLLSWLWDFVTWPVATVQHREQQRVEEYSELALNEWWRAKQGRPPSPAHVMSSVAEVVRDECAREGRELPPAAAAVFAELERS